MRVNGQSDDPPTSGADLPPLAGMGLVIEMLAASCSKETRTALVQAITAMTTPRSDVLTDQK